MGGEGHNYFRGGVRKDMERGLGGEGHNYFSGGVRKDREGVGRGGP